MSTLVFGQKGDVFIGADVGYTYTDIIRRPFVDRTTSPLASPSNLYDEERSFVISVLGEYYFANSWGTFKVTILSNGSSIC